jgi:hypothetical protein
LKSISQIKLIEDNSLMKMKIYIYIKMINNDPLFNKNYERAIQQRKLT